MNNIVLCKGTGVITNVKGTTGRVITSAAILFLSILL